MTIQEARKLFPMETESLADEALEKYCQSVDILSEMFFNALRYRFKQKDGIDNHEKPIS